jgi:hypothetical protein
MDSKQLKGVYQLKQDTYDQMVNEGTTDSSLYFVRDFDGNGKPTSSSIYLGDRKYGEMCNDTIEGNDVEEGIYIILTGNTEIYTDFFEYDSYFNECTMEVAWLFKSNESIDIDITIERSESINDQFIYGGGCVVGNGELTQVIKQRITNYGFRFEHLYRSHISFPKDSSKNLTIKYTFNDGVNQPILLTIHYVYNPT